MDNQIMGEKKPNSVFLSAVYFCELNSILAIVLRPSSYVNVSQY